jgi:hypothetical protein
LPTRFVGMKIHNIEASPLTEAEQARATDLVADMMHRCAQRVEAQELYGVHKHVRIADHGRPGIEFYGYNTTDDSYGYVNMNIESLLLGMSVTLTELRTSLNYGVPLQDKKLMHVVRTVDRKIHSIATEQIGGRKIVRDVPRDVAELVLPLVEIFPPTWTITDGMPGVSIMTHTRYGGIAVYKMNELVANYTE